MLMQALAQNDRCAHSKRRNRAGLHVIPTSGLGIPRDSAKIEDRDSATDTKFYRNSFDEVTEASKATVELDNVLHRALDSLG